MNAIASSISGRYDFYFLPIQLPTSIVQALLPAPWAVAPAGSSSSSPPTKADHSWVVVQAGWQIGTGPPMPGGKHDFEVSPRRFAVDCWVPARILLNSLRPC